MNFKIINSKPKKANFNKVNYLPKRVSALTQKLTQIKNKPYKLAVLRDRNGDLSKRWYVEYYLYHPKKNKLVRCQEYVSDRIKTRIEKYAIANEMIDVINKMLISGELKYTSEKINDNSTDIIQALNTAYDSLKLKNEKSSMYSYKLVIKRFKKFIEKDGVVTLQQFNSSKAKKFIRYLLSTDISNKTINNYKNFLSSMFSELRDEFELISTNPVIGIKSLKIAESKSEIWHPDDLVKFMNYTKEHDTEIYLASLFLFHVFARPTELTRIQKRDIDLKNSIIWIEIRKGKKNKKSQRSLSKEVSLGLSRRVGEMKSDDYLFSIKLLPGEKKIEANRFQDRFNKIKEKLNFHRKDTTFYELKHTGVSVAEAKKIPIINIRNQCGHSTVKTTEIYLKSLKTANDAHFYNFPDLKEVEGMFA